MRSIIYLAALGLALGSLARASAAGADGSTVVLTLKDHRFAPATVNVPAGQRIRIELVNRDGTADDFDSEDLGVDKELAPHGRASFVIGPLKPGSYAFKGELHAATARGEVVAVAPAP